MAGTRVLFLGLDATEATLLEQGFGDGPLPGIERLAAAGTRLRLTNRMDTLPGSIWPEINTGRSVGRAPFFYHPWQIHTGEAMPRPVAASEAGPETQFPAVAGRAGRTVGMVDLPHSMPVAGLDGAQIFEWGNHDRWLGARSEPEGLLDTVRDRYGTHPVGRCDRVRGMGAGAYELFLDDVLTGIERRRAMLCDLLEQRDWDLFAAAFSEAHCTGHQLWSLYDATHPLHGDDASARLRDGLPSVYRALDAAVSDVVARAGEDATIFVVTSHGMGPYVGGYQLLSEVVHRLGLGPPQSRYVRLRTRLGGTTRQVWRAVLPRSVRTRVIQSLEHSAERLDRPGTRVVAMPNNRCGAIRLNLAGREPDGVVQPGPEATQVLADLTRELFALRSDGGEPIVRSVLTAEEAFGPDHHPDVPDLMVAFRTDLGPIHACTSDTIGTVSVPLWNDRAVERGGWPNRPRTGDHTAQSRLWAVGPGIGSGVTGPDGDVLDLAPTVLATLGVALPAGLDGAALPLSGKPTSSV